MSSQPNLTGNRRGSPYLTVLGAWALAFGCAVGWGSFVMPGNTFLPLAGPVGSAIGLGLGAVVILIIADGLIIFIYVDAYMEPEMETEVCGWPLQ